MYDKHRPYFSQDGLAFRESNTAFEKNVNLRIALDRLRTFAMFGGTASEALEAIEFIEQECSKVSVITKQMRECFFDDDMFPDVDAGRLRRIKLQLCCDLDKRTQQNTSSNVMVDRD